MAFPVIPVVLTAILSVATATVSKVIYDYEESESIKNGVNKAAKKANDRIKEKTKKIMVDFIKRNAIYVLIILLSVYFFPLFFAKEISIFIIASLYLFIILLGVIGMVKITVEFFKFTKKYGFKINDYLQDEIFKEAFPEVVRSTDNIVYSVLSSKSRTDIAREISKKSSIVTFDLIKAYLLRITILVVLYWIIARQIVVPFLIEDATGMSTIEAFFYPFLFSIKFFYKVF